MKQAIENLYPTPILVAQLEGFEYDKVQREIGSAIDSVSWKQHPSFINTQLLTTDTFGDDIIKEKKLVVLGLLIDQFLKDYCKSLGFTSIGVYDMESWLTKNRPGDYSIVHNHGLSDISGVYYYDVTEDDGDFFFQSPSPAAVTSFTGQAIHGNIFYKPVNGKLFMFPSYINHGVMRNNSNKDRISLAFNIKFHRGNR